MNVNNTKNKQLVQQSPHTPMNNISNNNSLNPLPYITPPPAPRPSLLDRLQRSTFLFPKSLSSHRMMSSSSINSQRSISHGSIPEEREPSGKESYSYINSSNQYFQPRPARGSDGIRREQSTNDLPSSTSVIPKPLKKKSVHFQEENEDSTAITITLHYLSDTPLASDMTPRERSKIWYTSNEYDQFKYSGAKQAGVKIVRYDSGHVGTGHHFVMMGDFDGQYGNDADNSTSRSGSNSKNDASPTTFFNVGSNNETMGAAVASSTTSPGTSVGKCHYNENEYNDHRHYHASTGKETIVCKRGLGYHFSRSRKKSRMITRSAVIAWQKTLRDALSDPSSMEQPLPTAVRRGSESTLCKEEKDTMMLALVSTKCSRVAREEARWRGDVDYRVAYPERHRTKNAKRNIQKGEGESRCAVSSEVPSSGNKYHHHNSGSIASTKKRSLGSSISFNHHLMNGKNSSSYASSSSHTGSPHKRQRTDSRARSSSVNRYAQASRDGSLSPATISHFLNGVLHAEV